MMTKRSVFMLLTVVLICLVPVDRAFAEWGIPVPVSQEYFCMDADMVQGPDGKFHYAWSCFKPTGGSFIAYTSSSDGGATWSEPVELDNTGSGWSRVINPRLTADEAGSIHLAYNYLNFYGSGDIRVKRSVDGGATWDLKYYQWQRFYEWPTLSNDLAGNVVMTWGNFIRQELYFARSADGGVNWGGFQIPLLGGVSYGVQSYYSGEARSHLLDGNGVLHAVTKTSYGQSFDLGTTWNILDNYPADFLAWGIYQGPDELLVTGRYEDKIAYIRSTDGGYTWTGPFVPYNVEGWISQIIADDFGNYFVLAHPAPGLSQLFLRSRDGGATWEEPEAVTPGRYQKMVLTDDGRLLAVGIFTDPGYAGIVEYQEPAGVDAPDFLSLWEKETFLYSFQALGSDAVEVSFPADYVEIDPDVFVSVGDTQIPGTVSTVGDRVLVSFPFESSEWTTCSLPIRVTKGNVGKLGALAQSLLQKKTALVAALDSGQYEEAQRIDVDIMEMDREMLSEERLFRVTLSGNGLELATDETHATIYDAVTSVNAHLKANPPQGGAKLIMLSDDTVSLDIGEPWRLEVKVTHLTEGQTAVVDLSGEFQVLDVIETSETGKRKVDTYLFYPPTFTVESDIVTIAVTVEGVTTNVPFEVTLR